MAIVARARDTNSGFQLRRAAFRVSALTCVIGVALIASACGSAPSSKVAQAPTTGANVLASTNASSSGSPRAYSVCMRNRGIRNFPDPDRNGQILINGGTDKNQLAGIDTNSQQFRAAAKACQKLQPNGGRPTTAQQAKTQQALLKYAQCMRARGVPKFPDPKADGGLMIGPKTGVDPNAPQFIAAQQACKKLVPGRPIASPPPKQP